MARNRIIEELFVYTNREAFDKACRKTILFKDPKSDKSPLELLSALSGKGNIIKDIYDKASKIEKVVWPDGNDLPIEINKDSLEDLMNNLPNVKSLIIKAIRAYIVIPNFCKDIEKTGIKTGSVWQNL